MVEGFHPFVGLHVALHGFPERCALPPAALRADDKVQAGWMRSVGPALNVDVLSSQEVECGADAGSRCGDTGAGDDAGGVDVFFESWGNRKIGQLRDLGHDVVGLVRLCEAGIALQVCQLRPDHDIVGVLLEPLLQALDVVQAFGWD